jgi:putative ABC transport system substrate-binding protein
MKKQSWTRWPNSFSGNPKSKIQKRPRGLKSAGLLVILILLAGWLRMADAQQQPAKVPKIGWLSAGSASGPGSMLPGVQRDIQARGSGEGKHKAFAAQSQSAEDQRDRLHVLAEELVRLNVDVLIASSTAEALALKKTTKTTPIVFMVASDPVADGLVDSLARPGGNITGVTTVAVDLAGKRLELLKQTMPKLSRVAVLWDFQDPSSAHEWKESLFAARDLGLQLHSMAVSSVDKLDAEFKEAAKAGNAALAVTPSPLAVANPKLIAALAAKYRLPAIFDRGEFVENGGLMSYGPDRVEPYRRVAYFVDKILKGAKPADLPIEQPSKFELLINLKTAKTLGLTIPPVVLTRATKVIK